MIALRLWIKFAAPPNTGDLQPYVHSPGTNKNSANLGLKVQFGFRA